MHTKLLTIIYDDKVSNIEVAFVFGVCVLHTSIDRT